MSAYAIRFKHPKAALPFILSLVYILTNVVGLHATESSFWTQRRKFRQENGGGATAPATQMAKLPGGTALPDLISINVKSSPMVLFPENAGGLLSDPSFQTKLKALPSALTRIPTSYGDIRNIQLAENPKAPLIVLIQDAHQVLSAQKNIGNILAHLEEGGHQQNPFVSETFLVGIEGSAGAFDIPKFRSLPNQTLQREVATALFDKNLITGAEHFGLTGPREPILWGVEDKGLYMENVNAYRRGTAIAHAAELYVQRLQTALNPLKDRIFSPALKAFDHQMDQYRLGKLSLTDFVQALAKQPKVSMRRFPESQKFLETLDLEKHLDFKEVEKQRTDLVQTLTRRLNSDQLEELIQTSLAYRSGTIGHGAYYTHLKNVLVGAGISLFNYKTFDGYARYAIASERIIPSRLFEELEALKETAARSLTRDPKERALFQIQDDLRLAGTLLRHELNPDQWHQYQSRRASMMGIPSSIVALGSTDISMSSMEPQFQEWLSVFEAFYEAASKRDRALVDNFLGTLPRKEQGNGALSVLIAGGFHTAGLEKELSRRGISCVTLTPRITEVPEDASGYLSVFSSQRTPLEKMLLGEKLTTNPPSAFASEVPDPSLKHTHTAKKIAAAVNAVDPQNAQALGISTGEVGSSNGVKTISISLPNLPPLEAVVSARGNPSHDAAVRQAGMEGEIDFEMGSGRVTLGRDETDARVPGPAAFIPSMGTVAEGLADILLEGLEEGHRNAVVKDAMSRSLASLESSTAEGLGRRPSMSPWEALNVLLIITGKVNEGLSSTFFWNGQNLARSKTPVNVTWESISRMDAPAMVAVLEDAGVDREEAIFFSFIFSGIQEPLSRVETLGADDIHGYIENILGRENFTDLVWAYNVGTRAIQWLKREVDEVVSGQETVAGIAANLTTRALEEITSAEIAKIICDVLPPIRPIGISEKMERDMFRYRTRFQWSNEFFIPRLWDLATDIVGVTRSVLRTGATVARLLVDVLETPENVEDALLSHPLTTPAPASSQRPKWGLESLSNQIRRAPNADFLAANLQFIIASNAIGITSDREAAGSQDLSQEDVRELLWRLFSTNLSLEPSGSSGRASRALRAFRQEPSLLVRAMADLARDETGFGDKIGDLQKAVALVLSQGDNDETDRALSSVKEMVSQTQTFTAIARETSIVNPGIAYVEGRGAENDLGFLVRLGQLLTPTNENPEPRLFITSNMDSRGLEAAVGRAKLDLKPEDAVSNNAIKILTEAFGKKDSYGVIKRAQISVIKANGNEVINAVDAMTRLADKDQRITLEVLRSSRLLVMVVNDELADLTGLERIVQFILRTLNGRDLDVPLSEIGDVFNKDKAMKQYA